MFIITKVCFGGPTTNYGFIHEDYIGIKDKISTKNILKPAPGQSTSWKCRRIEIEVPGNFGTPAARSWRVSRRHEHAGLISQLHPQNVNNWE